MKVVGIIFLVALGLLILGIGFAEYMERSAYRTRESYAPLLKGVTLWERRYWNGEVLQYTDFLPEEFRDKVKHIVFTDQPRKYSTIHWETNRTDNSSVVSWFDDETWYISSRQKGKKVIAPSNSCRLFANLRVESIDVTMLDVSNVTKMQSMFRDCPRLRTITGLDTWDTSNVKDMTFMFDGCISLRQVNDLAHWDTSNVTNMSMMFRKCISLREVFALATWNTSKVEYMESMFSQCHLDNIVGLRNWDVSHVTDMTQMFHECIFMDIPQLNWDVSNVEHINGMFYIEDWHWHDATALENWGETLNSKVTMWQMFGPQVPKWCLPSWYR